MLVVYRFSQFIHARTVRRRLRDRHLRARRPYRGPVLTPRHLQQRLLWCRRHLNWTRRQWGDVLFTDESKFNVYMADGRQRVWRRRGERFANCCVQQHDRWGGGSVLVWAGVTSATRTQLVILNGPVNAQTYQNQVLNPVVRPFIRQHGGLLQQDNARAHTARATQQYLQAHNINTIAWPSLSPDLAPIEHVWDELGRRVYQRNPAPRNVNQLRQALLQEWQLIPQRRITNIINTMRQRCNACIAAGGGHTRF